MERKHYVMVFLLAVVIHQLHVFYVSYSRLDSLNFEKQKCPLCYGSDLCAELYDQGQIDGIRLDITSISLIINRLFSVKNVYFTTNDTVLKKLAHNRDLQIADAAICEEHGEQKECYLQHLKLQDVDVYKQRFLKHLTTNEGGFRLCGDDHQEVFMTRIANIYEKNVNWMQLSWVASVNLEMVLLQMFKQLPVPVYYGACGRMICVQNSGESLSHYASANWSARATISRNIIDIMLRFTLADDDFRIYLTDISADNIVVDRASLRATIVDLGNIILVRKQNKSKDLHYSLDFDEQDDGFMYSEQQICESTLSDHNIYATCKLLFAQNAPWPMMTGGLLHSAPESKELQIFNAVASCIRPTANIDRFTAIRQLDSLLKSILNEEQLLDVT